MKSPSPNASSTKIPTDSPALWAGVSEVGALGAAPPQAVTAHSRAAEQMATVQFRAFGCICGFLAWSGDRGLEGGRGHHPERVDRLRAGVAVPVRGEALVGDGVAGLQHVAHPVQPDLVP